MKAKANIEISVNTGAGGHSLNAVRYAAYSLSGTNYVCIEPSGKGSVSVRFEPKAGRLPANFRAVFTAALADEKLREKIFDENRELREFMILKALAGQEPAKPAADSGLTPEQEKELDALIAQVEKEVKEESLPGTGDPMGIAKRWEDKNVNKKDRKKK